MKRFVCHYITSSGDACKITVFARDHIDAAAQCYSETSYRPVTVEAAE